MNVLKSVNVECTHSSGVSLDPFSHALYAILDNSLTL
jgi:hypothetical protein